MNRATAGLALLALLLAGPAAAWQDLTAADFSMEPPPAPRSEASDKDYARLLELQAARTPDECAAAAAQAVPDFKSLFSGSGILSKAELDAVAPFVDAVSHVVSKISGAFKKKKDFLRPRPYDVDPRVKPCIPLPGGATSYPSTHATVGVADACVLAQIFPKRANIIASYGLHIGDLRVIAGVHHPTDVAAGQTLGRAICEKLAVDAEFLAEADRVKNSLP